MPDGRAAGERVLDGRCRFSFDGDYVRKLVAEDPETERHFTEYFGDHLTQQLRSRLRSPDLIEDVRQETFVRVLTTLKRQGGLACAESLGAFVNAVCKNVLRETYRARRRTATLEDAPVDPPADEPSSIWRLLKIEEQIRVRQAIAGLAAKDQALIRWVFFDDRDKDEVCRELHVDREYLRVLLHRAKHRLRERFIAAERQA